MAKQKIGQEELKKAKDYFKGKMILSLESSDDKATHFGLQELLMNKILTIEEVFAKIDKVSSLDLQKAAKEMFQEENLNLALIGPLKEEKQFKKLLKL